MQNAHCKLQIAEPLAPSPQSRAPFASRSSLLARRPAFTLFELILAIALSATLLVLIGSAINLYLLQVDASRTQIEEAQLARSILSTIAADVRAATVYQTQDTSAVAQLAASAASFDVDEMDASGPFTGGAIGASGGSSSAGSSSTAAYSSGTPLGGEESTTALAPGLNGTLQELILDVMRLPRLDELFPAIAAPAGTTPAQAVNGLRPSDVKTVRYILRQGNAVAASDAATTALAPEAQLQVGGLVRQTIDRAARDMAEQSGNTALLDSGQVLLAPEVVHIEFRYFDGATAVDQWIMKERQTMPLAIEVRIWLADGDAVNDPTARSGIAAASLDAAHMYSQTIELPLAGSTSAGAASTATDTAGAESTDTGKSDTSAFEG